MNNSNRLKEYLLNIMYVILPAVFIILACSYNDATYQTQKDIAAAGAVLAFMAYLFLIKKVQLFNWASLAVTVILIPLHYWHRSAYLQSADLLKSMDIEIWSQWLVLMIIVDMIRTAKITVNNLKKVNYVSVGLYILTYIMMMVCRNGRKEPNILIFPLLLFFFLPLIEEEKEKLIYRFCDSWCLAFVYMIIKSLIENPYTGGRYYGSFVNIGAFGVFVGGAFATALFRVIDAKRKKGVKSLEFRLGLAYIVLISAFIIIIGTRTLFLGLISCLAFMFVLGIKDIPRETMAKRLKILLVLFVISVIAVVVLAFACKDLNYKQWLTEANSGKNGSIAFIVTKFIEMGFGATCFNAEIFKPHSIINYLDIFSSGRLSLAKVFLENSKLLGTNGIGYQIGNYYAFTAHNAYIHLIYLYGIGGVCMIGWFVVSLIMAACKWIKKRDTQNLFALLMITMNIGLMVGEIQTFYFATMFTTLYSLRSIFYKDTDEYEDDVFEEDEDEELEYCYVFFEEE